MRERIYGPSSDRRLVYPRAPARYDGPRAADARLLRNRTRAALDRLLAWLPSVRADLCREPFPERSDARVRYLHVPKAGSSFMNCFLGYGCAAIGAREDLVLGGPVPRDFDAGGSATVRERALFQFAEERCATSHRFAFTGQSKPTQQLQRWTGHTPARRNEKNETLAGLFRAPDQRVLSAWHADKHVWGGEATSAGTDDNAEFGNGAFSRWRQFIHENATSPRQFAAAPGIAGCQARMLDNCFCAARPRATADGAATSDIACGKKWVAQDAAAADRAASRVGALGFVGLTAAFDASVCLFHRTFGGPVRKAEFSLFNAGAHDGAEGAHAKYALASKRPASLDWDANDLGDFVDVADEVVFARVVARFERDVRAALSGG